MGIGSMILSDQQQGVVKAVKNLKGGECLYVDGEAGVGKSTTLDMALSGMGNVIRCAPSAIAANNIGGSTLHRAFQLHGGIYGDPFPLGVRFRKLYAEYGPKEASRMQNIMLCKQRVETLDAASYVLIDESPTGRCDLIDEIDLRLRYARKKPDLPFGGARVVMSGDLGQLQSVVPGYDAWQRYDRKTNEPLPRNHTRDAKALLDLGYDHPFGCFESRILRRMREEGTLKEMHLTQLFRQSDPIFGAMLSRIRTASHTRQDIATLAGMVRKDPPLGATILCMYNREALTRNMAALRKLSSPLVELHAKRTGTYAKRNDKGQFSMRAPYAEVVKLKKGCRVIVKTNGKFTQDGMQIEYRNGEGAIFYGIDKHNRLILERTSDGQTLYVKKAKIGDSVDVKTTQVVTEIDEEGNEIEVERPVLEKRSKGTFEQYPVTLGYAQSIHSSQGLTLEKAHVILGPDRPFVPNLVYVACSRVRTPEGLTFSRALRDEDIWVIPGLRQRAEQQYEWNVA